MAFFLHNCPFLTCSSGFPANFRTLPATSRGCESASFPFPFPFLFDCLSATRSAYAQWLHLHLNFRLSLDGMAFFILILRADLHLCLSCVSCILLIYLPAFSVVHTTRGSCVCCLCILSKPSFRCVLRFMNFVVAVTLLFFYCKGRCQLHHE